MDEVVVEVATAEMDLYQPGVAATGDIGDGDSSNSNSLEDLRHHFGGMNLTLDQISSIVMQHNISKSSSFGCTFLEMLKEHTVPPPEGGCPANFDGLSCWSAAKASSLAVLPCLANIRGIEYNTTRE